MGYMNIFKKNKDTAKVRVIVKRFVSLSEDVTVFDGLAMVKKGEVLNINFDLNILFTEKSKLGKFGHYSLEFRDAK